MLWAGVLILFIMAKVKKESATEFIKKLKKSGGHLMRKIKTSDWKTMVYYREYGSYPTDIKTKTF